MRHPALSNGDVAQLVEHHICNVRVRGSNPLVSTRKCGMEAAGLPRSGADIYRVNMDHSDWIKNQFKKAKGRAWYRDIIIHASFVETVVKEVAQGGRNFEHAIKILQANSKHRGDKLDEIEKLRKLRNRMIHDILKDKNLTNEVIKATIKEMKEILKNIYHHSLLVQEYFKKHYNINTKEFV